MSRHAHTKKSSSPSSSSLHSTIHPPIVIGIVVITIFFINDNGTYGHYGSSIAAPPRSTGLVCSSTNRCSLKRDRLVVCVPQVQVSSNGQYAGLRPSIDSFAQDSLARKKSIHPFHSIHPSIHSIPVIHSFIHSIHFIHSISFIHIHSHFDSSLLQGDVGESG